VRYPHAMRALRYGIPLAALLVASCENPPPPGWAKGGAPLVIKAMSWKTGDGQDLAVSADGKVTNDGDLLFSIDRAGRVYDDDNEPVALLLPDGTVEGSEGTHLGQVGVTNAAPPGGGNAWLAVLPDGHVLHFEPDGERTADGVWQGCDGPQHRTCTLVSHLFTLHRVAAAESHRGGVTFGVGMGIGVWR
jgi:hypothetical protein